MFEFERPNIEVEEISEDKKYGRFVVEPLERGYGITLGNSLRRIMLSSLPGAAVSQVKIEGVLHEFSSIPGVKEDVTEIIMNIKSLAIKNTSETNEPKTAYIEFEGEGIVTAISGGSVCCDSSEISHFCLAGQNIRQFILILVNILEFIHHHIFQLFLPLFSGFPAVFQNIQSVKSVCAP